MTMMISRAFLAGMVILLAASGTAQTTRGLLLSAEEAKQLKQSFGKYPLLDKSYQGVKQFVDEALRRPIEVPPPGEAGGYAHERHKQNYREMQGAGMLYRVTGEAKYAAFVRDVLLQYAAMYPKLGAHPRAHIQAPGKLFHQMLNEAVWLVYVSQAYDCVHARLTPVERKTIEENIFRPMVEWFTGHNGKEFDRIHNHGTWSVAAVGMLGYVLHDKNLVEMSLRGTKKDGNGGFLKQLDLLFSPDGYYMEGPYYARYALMPFFFFAEAIHRNQPELGIYQYRNQILKKALYSAVQTVFPNGVFPPINDASPTMDVKAPEVVLAMNLTYLRYGPDRSLLGVARIQDDVVLNGAGIAVARDFSRQRTPPAMNWGSVEFTDGHDGTRGGLGILRMGGSDNETMLLMKYGVHGEGHGHFDKLQFILFEQGREVIPDYGYARWINIEPKFGGRYLPENDSYAMQTVSHNTVTVDGKTQNNNDLLAAEEVWGERHFFDASKPDVKVMSARADKHYEGVKMQRTMLLLRDERLPHPVVIDLYRLSSSSLHQYDYPIHFRGLVISSSVGVKGRGDTLVALGASAGYQHLWREAAGKTDAPVQVTWLDGNRYYTATSSAFPGSELLFARSGANDPNFNLRSEPMFIIRRKAQDHLFATVLEPHGYFNEAREQSRDARSAITSVSVIGYDEQASVIEIFGKNNLRWRVIVNNGAPDAQATRTVNFGGKEFRFTGNYAVELKAQ